MTRIFRWIITLPVTIVLYFIFVTVFEFLINILIRFIPLLIDIILNTKRNHDFEDNSIIAAIAASYLTLSIVYNKIIPVQKNVTKYILAVTLIIAELLFIFILSSFLNESFFNGNILRAIGTLIGGLIFIFSV